MYNINQSHLASIQLFRIFQETLSVIFAGQKIHVYIFMNKNQRLALPEGGLAKQAYSAKVSLRWTH